MKYKCCWCFAKIQPQEICAAMDSFLQDSAYIAFRSDLLSLKNSQSYPIYRHHALQRDGLRFYYSREPPVGESDFNVDGVAFYGVPKHYHGAIPIYQFHYDQSKTYGGHRFWYSTDLKPEEEGYTKDHIAFYAYYMPKPGTVPVYSYHVVQPDGRRQLLSTKLDVYGWNYDSLIFYAEKGLIE